ncbi:conserved exported hypothetical protein [Candidatus Sulfopaludibacter sp. SbA3]|nr:conserved exported hypothetical protein [Candidatus Sulfopaludibacter sp. SbA3]
MNLDRMFQAGLGLAILGVVWAVWPQPGLGAYTWQNRFRRSAYHRGPAVLIDRGHWNRSVPDPRFEGLLQMLTWDGYQVARNRQDLVPELLRTTRVLVIPNALGWKGVLQPLVGKVGLRLHPQAFSVAEVEAVRDWVHGGGSLLLIADRAPAAEASQALAGEFGVRLVDGGESTVPFSRDGGLGDDAIANGRPEEGEEVEYAVSFSGGKLWGPPGSMTFLKEQGVAFESGRGRVVALTAQLAGPQGRSTDNRQLMLNIMHWLSRR